MFSCISHYFSYYYNYYFNSNIPSILQETHSYSKLTQNNQISPLDITDSYKQVFSTNNSSINIKLLFYQMYSNNDNVPTFINPENLKIFKYQNKLFKINSKKNYNNYINIINIILNNNLKNIITPEEIYSNQNKNYEYIEIFPYYSDGDLFTYVENTDLTFIQINNIYTQIVNIIYELHTKQIAHRDIKLENFLIQFENNQLIIKITDLDFCCIATTDLNFKGGTIQYASYELMNFKTVNNWYSSDIWSLTVILHILLFNTFPWSNSYNSINTNKSCIIFNDYLSKKPYEYWNLQLITKYNKNDKYFNLYNYLLTYGFNINWKEREDINYIKYLLTQV